MIFTGLGRATTQFSPRIGPPLIPFIFAENQKRGVAFCHNSSSVARRHVVHTWHWSTIA